MVETLVPERHREAHIPGALNIPPEQNKELAPELLPNKDAEIIPCCTNDCAETSRQKASPTPMLKV